MPLSQIPPITLMHPMMGYPMLMRMRTIPVAANPYVLTAFPAPVATQPHIAGGGRRTIFLDPDRRRGHHDRGTRVIPVRWRRYSDDASAERDCQHGNRYQLGCPRTKFSHIPSLKIDGGRQRIMVIGWLTTMALIVALPA
jgi:hypothetical protein